MFRGQTYDGSSFFELLRVDAPHLLPDFSGMDWAAIQIPHATTILALRYEDGALMAGDRLATAGHQVATRDVEKVFKIDDTCLMAIAGAAGPAVEMVRIFQLELEHYEKIEGQEITFEGKANRLSFLLRQNLPAAMQGLVVMPLFCGYDHELGRARIYKFDITGGRYREEDYYADGSGGKDARSSLKKAFRPGMSRDEAVRAAVAGLVDAADEDRATGGADLQRGIFPIVKLATRGGIEEVSEDEVRRVYELEIASRRDPA
ncbi:MAG: proteasome subunit beta [Proteobacteria bacterium]|nr:proteasome subunit beta [Pseudomonadota bacterium]